MYSDQIKTKSSLPHSLYRAQQIKEYEGQAAELAGSSLYGLMKRAGEACFQVFKTHFPDVQRVLVLTGRGNNGGDGYIFAAIAKDAGFLVQLCQMGDAQELSGDAAQARDAWLVEQGVIDTMEQADFTAADVIVDALLGTGLSGPVRGDYEHLIDKINRAGKPVLSVDLPSGLNADSGAIANIAVQAAATITLVGLKQGLLTGSAADNCGQLYFSGLGISEQFSQLATSSASRISYQQLSGLLTARKRCSHKGRFGRALIVGGNIGMPGAVRLAGEAALRCGSGLVKVLTRQENRLAVINGRPELMLAECDVQTVNTEALRDWATTLVVGPGLGNDDWAENLFSCVLASDLPMVVDADGLNLLAKHSECKNNWILTPHPGEAANLLGCTTAEIEQDRFAAVRELQHRFGGVVILKGAGTLICDAQQIYVANVGNPGMASGGMGDVLSGIIGGLLAQGLNLSQAAMLAVCIHGLAADLAAGDDERGLLGSDLFPYIRKLVNPNV